MIPVVSGVALFERACPVCRLYGGFHDYYGPDHTRARDEIPVDLIKVKGWQLEP